jgi:hypothetical protein
MASTETQARHVFHAPSTGLDRIHAWQEATGEPAFIWGRHSGMHEARLFGSIRKAFSDWVTGTGDSAVMTIYHDGIGADALGPLDPAAHKVFACHHWYPRWQNHFEWQLRCTGKVLVGDPEMGRAIRERFGWIPERFIQAIPQHLLTGPVEAKERPSEIPRRTGIWLHGKRWRRYGNRLRSIVDRWQLEVGELEIITEGGGPPGWAKRENIIWNTGMPLEFALYRLYTWDSILLLNDYALDAPWLLRALALDCFPLVPDGDSPAKGAAWHADSAPSPYAWGNASNAIDLLGQWRDQKADLLEDFHEWRDGVLAGHATGAAFRKNWSACKAALLEQRPPKLRDRKPLAGWMPVGWYERVIRLRTGA